MAPETIQIQIPFQVVVEVAEGLSLQDKLRLWQWLGEQLAQAEELSYEQDPAVQAEIREARTAYENGDFVTLDEYLEQQDLEQ